MTTTDGRQTPAPDPPLTLEDVRALDQLRVAARQLGLPDFLVNDWANGCLQAAHIMRLLWTSQDLPDDIRYRPHDH